MFDLVGRTLLFEKKRSDVVNLDIFQVRGNLLPIVFKYVTEEFFCNNRWKILFPAIIEITTPSVCIEVGKRVFCFFDFECSPAFCASQKVEGVKMNIVENVKKICVGIDVDLFVRP